MNKLSELLVSRRFGGSIAGVVAAVLCYRSGLIDADKAAVWIEHALELYVTMIGGEHVVKAWRGNEPKPVGLNQIEEDTQP